MLRSIILALIFIACAGLGATALLKFRPRAEHREISELVTPVRVQVAKASTQRIQIHSQGSLEARTLTNAAAEVGGKVLFVAPQFEAGGVICEGDVLLEIDPSDYQAAVAQAESAVAQARLIVEVEQAKAEQSVRDWKKLGREKAPSSLVMRKPQLASAKAQLVAAVANLAKSQRDLERTKLLAPYDGRVLRTHTDVASFVAPGAPLADFYESDRLEIRLPIALEDYGFIDETKPIEVTLSIEVAGEVRKWDATVKRQDAEVDRRSRSIHLIASLDPEAYGDPLLVPGLFVRAVVVGKQLENVFKLPRLALTGRDRLRIVIPNPTQAVSGVVEGKLMECQVQVVRAEADIIFVSEGLTPLDQVCLSPVPTFIDGMDVSVKKEEPLPLEVETN